VHITGATVGTPTAGWLFEAADLQSCESERKALPQLSVAAGQGCGLFEVHCSRGDIILMAVADHSLCENLQHGGPSARRCAAAKHSGRKQLR
jgi:hypothetical protein